MSSQDAVSGPSGIQKECLFCKTEKDLEKIQKNELFSLPKHICTGCQVRESFTVAKLADKIRSDDLMNQIQEMDFFKKLDIREGSDVSDVLLGYLELENCGVCHMEIPRNISAEQHCQDDHPDVSVMQCSFGCGRQIRIDLMNKKNHGLHCGKFCNYEGCKKIFHSSERHFTNVHKPFFCPIPGCIQGFSPWNIEPICTHIVNTHLFHLASQVSPPKKPKTAENQPDVVAGPSGPTKKCSYCDEHKTDCLIVHIHYLSGDTLNICSECREEEKLTLAELIEAFKKDGHEVNLEYIRKMPIFAPYKLAQASDFSDVTLGFWILKKKCYICNEQIKWSVSMDRHFQYEHLNKTSPVHVELVKCPHGCGKDMEMSSIPAHGKDCFVECPYPGCIDRDDKPSYPRNDGHFKTVHKLIFCPFKPCASWRYRPDEFEYLWEHIAEEHLNRLRKHIPRGKKRTYKA